MEPFLEPLEFYQLVRRNDLVSAHYGRRSLKIAVAVGGLGLMTLAGGMLASELGNPCVRILGRFNGACLEHAHSSMIIPGIAVAGSGLVAFIVGLAIPQRHVQQAEAEKMVETYNARLKQELEASTPAEPASTPTGTLRVAPVLTSGGGHLLVGGTF